MVKRFYGRDKDDEMLDDKIGADNKQGGVKCGFRVENIAGALFSSRSKV